MQGLAATDWESIVVLLENRRFLCVVRTQEMPLVSAIVLTRWAADTPSEGYRTVLS